MTIERLLVGAMTAMTGAVLLAVKGVEGGAHALARYRHTQHAHHAGRASSF